MAAPNGAVTLTAQAPRFAETTNAKPHALTYVPKTKRNAATAKQRWFAQTPMATVASNGQAPRAPKSKNVTKAFV